MEKKVCIYDLQQFSNFHSRTFVNRDDKDDVRVFVIHKFRDDKEAYFKFLTEEVDQATSVKALFELLKDENEMVKGITAALIRWR